MVNSILINLLSVQLGQQKSQQLIAMATQDKYDRQLRLWGAAGQRALGNTLVVLVGSSACGTE